MSFLIKAGASFLLPAAGQAAAGAGTLVAISKSIDSAETTIESNPGYTLVFASIVLYLILNKKKK